MVIEIIVICLFFTAAVITGNKRDPLSGLHNLPTAIQKRVNTLPEYADRQSRILTTAQRIRKKLPALFVTAAAFCGLICLAGAMIYVVVEELIPEMSEGEHSNIGTIAFAIGFTAMMILDTALG